MKIIWYTLTYKWILGNKQMIIKLQIIVPEMLGTERVWGACMDIPKRGKKNKFYRQIEEGGDKSRGIRLWGKMVWSEKV